MNTIKKYKDIFTALPKHERFTLGILALFLLVLPFGVILSLEGTNLLASAAPRERIETMTRNNRSGRGGDRGNGGRISPVPTVPITVAVTPSPTGTGGRPTDGDGGGSTGGIQPYAGAPECAFHDDRMYHGLWNSELGCHYDHEHRMNPHDLDDIFGTQIYEWMGAGTGKSAELSYPWQTYAGAGANFESYVPGTATENTAKHEGYKWNYFRGKDSSTGALLLGSHTITDARVLSHQIGGQVGAFTRFHSTLVQVRACWADQVTPASQGVVTQTCGTYVGGGWLDFGSLNYPQRGVYAPLPGDDPAFANKGAELAPYRIHSVGQNSLDSWQSEGNEYNYLTNDPTGSKRLMVGHGIHFDLGESIGETNPSQYGQANANIHFWCVDPATSVITCDNNNSASALFRTWVKIPQSLDGSSYDEDGSKNGYFTFHGYTNRYGDIVTNCSSVGLDCVPAQAEHFPIGGCGQDRCRAAYRGDLSTDLFDGDIAPAGEHWIKYPN